MIWRGAGGEAGLRRSTPPAPPSSPPVLPAKETIAAWASYAKDRFDATSKRVDEFRSWSRQLAGVIGVVVGLECTLVGRLLDIKNLADYSLYASALGVLLLTILVQLAWPLRRALKDGYLGHQLMIPESPTKLAEHIQDADETKTKQYIGSYYGKASDGLHELSETLAVEVGQTFRIFRVSLFGLLFGLCLYTGGAMSNRTGSQPPPTSSPVPSAAPAPSPTSSPAPTRSPAPSPAAPPIVVTPTPGQVGTFTRTPAPAPPVLPTRKTP